MSMKLITELEKLHAFLHGAHLSTVDDNAGVVLHQACQKVDDLLKLIQESRNHALESVLDAGSQG